MPQEKELGRFTPLKEEAMERDRNGGKRPCPQPERVVEHTGSPIGEVDGEVNGYSIDPHSLEAATSHPGTWITGV